MHIVVWDDTLFMFSWMQHAEAELKQGDVNTLADYTRVQACQGRHHPPFDLEGHAGLSRIQSPV